MAAGILQPPGTIRPYDDRQIGPCQKGACQHRDCLATHGMAETPCHHCGGMIGFDCRFYQTDAGLAHAVCEENAVLSD